MDRVLQVAEFNCMHEQAARSRADHVEGGAGDVNASRQLTRIDSLIASSLVTLVTVEPPSLWGIIT